MHIHISTKDADSKKEGTEQGFYLLSFHRLSLFNIDHIYPF